MSARQTTSTITLASVAALVLIFAPCLFAAPPDLRTVTEVAVQRRLPPGAPKASDVCFSDRFKRGKFDLIKAFHTTRIDWVYTERNEPYISAAKANGYSFVSASFFPPALADTPGSKTYEMGRAVTLDGEMFTWPGRVENHGCYNNPHYRRIWLEHAHQEVDAGADAIQVDSCGYGTYILHRGGCYCRFCLAGFREHVREHTTPGERTSLGIEDIASFDYADYLRRGQANAEPLNAMFRDFQMESSLRFLRDVHQEIDTYAGRKISNSTNSVGPLLDWLYPVHDYGVCEAYAQSEGVPKFFYNERMRRSLEVGQPIVWTLAATDKPLTRRFIAICYALGSQMIVPWDVFLPSGGRRYYGKPEEYADLYGFVRANAEYLDGYQEAAVSGPGLRENRYGDSRPLRIDPGHDAYGVVRVLPGRPDAPVVIHLVDYSDEPAPFTVILDPLRLFGNRPMKLRLLVPPDYVRSVHEAAENTQDFASLSKCLALPGGCMTMVRIPTLKPWGMLVLEPDDQKTADVWQPAIWTDEDDHYADTLKVRIACATPGATVRYTTDGGEPTASAASYTHPILLDRDAVVRARAFKQGANPSVIASVSFRKAQDRPTPLVPDANSLKANLRLWLRADTLAAASASAKALGDGDSVVTWFASAGPPAKATPVELPDGSTATPPAFKENVLNGLPVVRFDGVCNRMAVEGFANRCLADSPFTVLLVTKSPDGNFGLGGNQFNGMGGIPRLYFLRDTFHYNELVPFLGAVANSSAASIAAFVHDGDETASAFVNGVAKATQGGEPTLKTPVVKRFAGGHLAMPLWSQNKNHPGDIAEIVVFDRALSDTERRGVEAYFARKYGIRMTRRWR